MITMVYPANIINVWPQVEMLLSPCIALHGTHNPEDVRKSILGGNSQLWIEWSDKTEAAVVTEFVPYPKGLWLRFWLAGALKDAKIQWNDFYKTLEEFAKNNNCKGIEDCGREGWSHYAPQAKKVFSMRRIVL